MVAEGADEGGRMSLRSPDVRRMWHFEHSASTNGDELEDAEGDDPLELELG